ncbi:MAG: hypothetical protein EHM36_06805, partial [Deltaproteobacteria bacterium]
MKHLRMEKVMIGALLTSLFLIAVSCQTLPEGKPAPGGMTEQERPVRSTFNRERLCSLLTKEEVGAVLKQKMEEPKFFVSECTYRVVQPSPLKAFSIQISTDDGSGFNYNKESGKRQGRRVREVQGIGNGAYFDDAHFHVLKGNAWLTFGLATFERGPSSEEMITNLAKKAADRVPGPPSEAVDKAP